MKHLWIGCALLLSLAPGWCGTLPRDAISVEVAYNPPPEALVSIVFRNNTPDTLQVVQRDVTVTNATFGKMLPPNTPEALQPTPPPPPLKEFSLGQTAASLPFDPETYGYTLEPGQLHLVTMQWTVSRGEDATTIARTFPYYQPAPVKDYASEWVDNNGLHARLHAHITEDGRGSWMSMELRNTTAATITFDELPTIWEKLTYADGRDALRCEYHDPSWRPVLISVPPGAVLVLRTASFVADKMPPGTDAFLLSLDFGEYALYEGAYRLSARMALSVDDNWTFRWEIPAFTFTMPDPGMAQRRAMIN